ncbi:MAG: Imidazole glycerol phosphate synthase subunit HisF [Verrucomicrobia subdivision 3 bacterium]|nr:Imidazole glycerol phosphate synthase subunit HisF [Limisphaerales bacterium]MCS1415863.1 Imidazole glycerol phosphate synthase subunit HisF [Limisphaerales bacterium]
MLGPGNEDAARSALEAFPGGLQAGGGINPDNALDYLRSGASHVIVTSWLFNGDHFDSDKLVALSNLVGRDRLVVDLSCRKVDDHYLVVTNRWQTFTSLEISARTLSSISDYCAEFLIHAADIEGLCQGIDLELVELLASASPLPITYAGGAQSLDDLHSVHDRSAGRVDLTIGSALDIFGGSGVRYTDAVAFNRSLGS